jgi:hypothetical protein
MKALIEPPAKSKAVPAFPQLFQHKSKKGCILLVLSRAMTNGGWVYDGAIVSTVPGANELGAVEDLNADLWEKFDGRVTLSND